MRRTTLLPCIAPRCQPEEGERERRRAKCFQAQKNLFAKTSFTERLRLFVGRNHFRPGFWGRGMSKNLKIESPPYRGVCGAAGLCHCSASRGFIAHSFEIRLHRASADRQRSTVIAAAHRLPLEVRRRPAVDLLCKN